MRPLIAPTVGVQLVALGFKNPGRAMWRYREHFVDVVAFRCEKYARGFVYEFGCTLRAGARMNPAPWECELRGPSPSFAERSYFPFQSDAASQRAQLERLAPIVAGEAAGWFAPFQTLQTAIEYVEHDAGITKGRPGSPVHVEVLHRLRAALEASEGIATTELERENT